MTKGTECFLNIIICRYLHILKSQVDKPNVPRCVPTHLVYLRIIMYPCELLKQIIRKLPVHLFTLFSWQGQFRGLNFELLPRVQDIKISTICLMAYFGFQCIQTPTLKVTIQIQVGNPKCTSLLTQNTQKKWIIKKI